MKRATLLTVGIVLVVSMAVGLNAADIKWQPKAPEQPNAKGHLETKVVAPDRVTLEHDSDPLRGQLESKPKAGRATAYLQYDDGTATWRSLFVGTTPIYFWGNTFQNPGSGTFTVAAVTPYVGNPSTPGTDWPCTGQTVFMGDGVVTVAAVGTGTAPIYGMGAQAYTSAGFVPVPLTGATVTAANSTFVAGHLIDVTDCAGTNNVTNHFGELVYFDVTSTGGGNGGGLSNAFYPGVSTAQAFIGTRTIFTRATIVGPNVPVELSRFTAE